MTGGSRFSGGFPAAITTALRLELIEPVPTELCAVRRYRRLSPRSAPTSVYVLWVPPETLVHAPVAWTHRCHWYVNVNGVVPDHVPSLAVSVCPTWAVPLGLGCPVAAGAEPAFATAPVGAEKTEEPPALFDAVTFTRTVCPTSEAVSLCVGLSAPPIALQLAPEESHRCQA